MDIFAFGMQMEKDGQAYFEEQAGITGDRHIARILTYLAEEEEKHYDILKKFRDGSKEVPKSRLLSDVKNVFQEMKEKNEPFVGVKDTIIDVLRKGMGLEDKSIDFYKTRAEEMDDPDQKDLFMLLKKHEERHYALLDSMIEFYERPFQWLEQAEFSHQDDY